MENLITRILVPSDFSESSDAALEYARMLADRFGASSFVPVAIHDSEAVATPALATAVAGPLRGSVRRLVEIDLPNGCRVRVEQDIPTAALRRIIGALARR